MYALAHLRMQGVMNSAMETVEPKILQVSEEGSALSAVGLFEKVVADGGDAGLYLDGVQVPLRFPLTINSIQEVEHTPNRNPIGLRIVREGRWPVRKENGVWGKSIGWTEVQAITGDVEREK